MAQNLSSDFHHPGLVTSTTGRLSLSTGQHRLCEALVHHSPSPVHIHPRLQAVLGKKPAQSLVMLNMFPLPSVGCFRPFCCYGTELGKFTCVCACTCEGLGRRQRAQGRCCFITPARASPPPHHPHRPLHLSERLHWNPDPSVDCRRGTPQRDGLSVGTAMFSELPLLPSGFQPQPPGSARAPLAKLCSHRVQLCLLSGLCCPEGSSRTGTQSYGHS